MESRRHILKSLQADMPGKDIQPREFVSMFNNIIRRGILIMMITAMPFIAAGASFPPPPVTPPEGHPRLFLRPSDLDEMKRRTNNAVFAKAWSTIVKNSASVFDGNLASAPANYDARIHDVAEACALRYLVEGDTALGAKAVSLMRNVLPAVTFPDKQDITREKGATILSAAIVYDWCYPLLSADDKKLFINNMKRIAKLTEIGYPPFRQGAVTGHAGEAQLMRDQLGGGIAVFDEDPEMYTYAASRFFAEFVPARDFFYPSHWHHQGSSYGPYRFQWEVFASWIFKRMSGTNVFTADQGQLPYAWVYGRRPDGAIMADGDASNLPKRQTDPPFPMLSDMMVASLYRDPVLAGISARRIQAKDRTTHLLWYFLFHDPSVSPAAYDTLPLSRYFKDPAGILIARTGWEEGTNANTVVAQMKIAPWMFNNHQQLDAGHFQIWYKGILASDSGIYQGTEGGYGSEHDINYHKRTIAHNTVTVSDPGEVFLWGSKPVANDGGQRWPVNSAEPVTLEVLKVNGYHVGRVLAHAMGPDAVKPLFSHLAGDIGGAYSNKVERFIRSFVYLNLNDGGHPAALIVYDRIRAAQPSFKKTWLLHAPEKPELAAAAFSVHGVRGGRMDASVLMPKGGDVRLELVGGEGKEFTVNGKNYPQFPQKGKLTDFENAGWRVELSPASERNDDRFLVVMQVRDDNPAAAPLAVTTMEGNVWTGVRMADRVVIFPASYDDIAALQFSAGVKAHCCITGAAAGRWKVKHDGTVSEIAVSDEGHVLEFFASGSVDAALIR